MLDFFSGIHFSPDSLSVFDEMLMFIKHLLTLFGSLVILGGAVLTACQFVYRFVRSRSDESLNFDRTRLNLTRSIILGLEFIIAADVIQTTTTPDYYAVGILAAVALIRAFLNYSLNNDLNALMEEKQIQVGEGESRS